jgi:hypothetical protein
VHFESRSLRLEGLVRLAGYVHGRRSEFGRKLRPDWSRLLSTSRAKSATVVVAEHLQEAMALQRWDEAGAMFRETLDAFLTPLARDRPVRLALVCASSLATAEGLALYFDSEQKIGNTVPFEGKVIEDRAVPILNSWEFVERALRP